MKSVAKLGQRIIGSGEKKQTGLGVFRVDAAFRMNEIRPLTIDLIACATELEKRIIRKRFALRRQHPRNE